MNFQDYNANDVFFARGHGANNTEGNRRYRQVVNEYAEAYKNSRKTKEKQSIANQVIDEICRRGGKFFHQPLNAKGFEWYELNPTCETVLVKVKSALRDCHRSKQQKERNDVVKNTTRINSINNKGMKDKNNIHSSSDPVSDVFCPTVSFEWDEIDEQNSEEQVSNVPSFTSAPFGGLVSHPEINSVAVVPKNDSPMIQNNQHSSNSHMMDESFSTISTFPIIGDNNNHTSISSLQYEEIPHHPIHNSHRQILSNPICNLMEDALLESFDDMSLSMSMSMSMMSISRSNHQIGFHNSHEKRRSSTSSVSMRSFNNWLSKQFQNSDE